LRGLRQSRPALWPLCPPDRDDEKEITYDDTFIRAVGQTLRRALVQRWPMIVVVGGQSIWRARFSNVWSR